MQCDSQYISISMDLHTPVYRTSWVSAAVKRVVSATGRAQGVRRLPVRLGQGEPELRGEVGQMSMQDSQDSTEKTRGSGVAAVIAGQRGRLTLSAALAVAGALAGLVPYVIVFLMPCLLPQ